MFVEFWTALEKSGPGLPSLVTIPSDSKLLTVSPAFGTYAAKRWSNERFSPTITITCLMGVAVLELSRSGSLPSAARAGVRLGPSATASVSNNAAAFAVAKSLGVTHHECSPL